MDIIKSLEVFYSKYYEKKPLIRTLGQITPIGSAIDTWTSIKINNIKEKRIKVFLDQFVSLDGLSIPAEVVELEDFIHCYLATVKIVSNTRREEKIKMFASLLKNTFDKSIIVDTDEYEEYMLILDELSYKEIAMLIELEKLENKTSRSEDENDLQYSLKFWDEFQKILIEEMKIDENEIDSKISRLERSGCYETFKGNYFGYSGGKGKTTPMFKKLKSLIVE